MVKEEGEGRPLLSLLAVRQKKQATQRAARWIAGVTGLVPSRLVLHLWELVAREGEGLRTGSASAAAVVVVVFEGSAFLGLSGRALMKQVGLALQLAGAVVTVVGQQQRAGGRQQRRRPPHPHRYRFPREQGWPRCHPR